MSSSNIKKKFEKQSLIYIKEWGPYLNRRNHKSGIIALSSLALVPKPNCGLEQAHMVSL